MKLTQIAAQLYSFRDFIKTPAGLRDTLRRLRSYGYSAVQLSGAIPVMPEAELAALLADEGFAAPTSHESPARLVNEPDALIARLAALSCRHVAYPFPHWMPTGLGECVALAEELERTAQRYRDAGITFSYHNHAHELQRFEGRTLLDVIYDNAPTLEAELDTYWIQRGGADPVAWIERLTSRMQVIHLKDYGVKPGTGDGVMAPVGAGNLDWVRILAAAARAGVAWYVIEHDADVLDPFASFSASLDFLKTTAVEH